MQLAQVGEQRGDLAADVLVDAMESDERIEDEEDGPQGGDGGLADAARSSSRSSRRLGAVITWIVEFGERHGGGAQMPSRRVRTTCKASSAG